MNAYLVRQQQQRQVAKRMPSMLTTAVCVRPIGTQAIRFYGQNQSYQKREEYFCVFAAILLFVFLFRVSVCVFFPLFSFSFFFFCFLACKHKNVFFFVGNALLALPVLKFLSLNIVERRESRKDWWWLRTVVAKAYRKYHRSKHWRAAIEQRTFASIFGFALLVIRFLLNYYVCEHKIFFILLCSWCLFIFSYILESVR